MRSVRCLFMVLLVLALTAPGPVWSFNEPSLPAGEKIAAEKGTAAEHRGPTGRGEGFEHEGEAAKGVEIPATFGPIVTDTAIPVEKGKFAIQPTFGCSVVTDSFDRKWARASAGGDFQSFTMDWKLSYGLMQNMEVFVVIPYVHNWAGSIDVPGPHGERSANSGNLGDINLSLKYRLVEETETLPTVTTLFATDFPSGKFRHLNPDNLGTDATGGGPYVLTPGINVSKYVKPFILYGNLWYSMPTSYRDDDGNQYPGDFVTVNLAGEYPITEKWVGLLELTSFWGCARLFGPDVNVPYESLLSVVPGIEYMATDKLSFALGLNIDLVGKNTDATIAPLLSMVYAF